MKSAVPIHTHANIHQGGKIRGTVVTGVDLSGGGSGGGGDTPASPAALDDLTDVTLTTPAEDDTLRYVGSEWVNDNRRWEPVTTNPGGGPEIVFDGDDIVMTWKVY